MIWPLIAVRIELGYLPQGEYVVAKMVMLREARTSNTIAKYFPDIAFALARHPGRVSARDLQNLDDANPIWFDDAESLWAIQRAIFAGSTDFKSAEGMIDLIPSALQRLFDPMPGPNYKEYPIKEGDFRQKVDDAFKEERKSANPDLGMVLDEDFSTINSITGRNRFLLTITCAAASEFAWASKSQDGAEGVPTGDCLSSYRVAEWFVSLETSLLAVAPREREDSIIDNVLGTFQQLHEEGLGLSFGHQLNQNLKKQISWLCGTDAELWRAFQGPDG